MASQTTRGARDPTPELLREIEPSRCLGLMQATREHGEKRTEALHWRPTASAQGERHAVLHLEVRELAGHPVRATQSGPLPVAPTDTAANACEGDDDEHGQALDH